MHQLREDKMLTKLLPEQISKFWDIIKYAVEQSLPPIVGEHPDKMNRILASALSGKVEVWASYTKGDTNKFEGIVLTELLFDDVSQTRNLLIYCLYGYTDVNEGSWLHGIQKLGEYAKSRKCSRVVAYSDVPYIIELASKLGAETKYTFISFNLER